MDKFRNKYRIPSTRLQNWDYGWNAAYFVTICTANRKFYFGDIHDKKMELSCIGVIADILLFDIKNHSQTAELDAFVVMPNHVHVIIILNDSNLKGYRSDGDDANDGGINGDGINGGRTNDRGTNGDRTNGGGINSGGANGVGTNDRGTNGDGINGGGINGRGTNGDGINGGETNGDGTNGGGINGDGINGGGTNGVGTNGDGTNGGGTNGGGTNGDGTNGDGINGGGTNGRGTNVETRHALSQRPAQPLKPPQSPSPEQTIGQQRFQNQGKNTLSSIIGSYKSAVTKHAHRLGFDFAWQPSFHDHVIRNNEEYQRIKNYIINNPAKWNEDTFSK